MNEYHTGFKEFNTADELRVTRLQLRCLAERKRLTDREAMP